MQHFLKKIIEAVLSWQTQRYLDRHSIFTIAITGSVGKTSTKQAVHHLLKDNFRVRSGISSYNTRIGLPLSVFAHTAPKTPRNPFSWFRILFQNELRIFSTADIDTLVLEMGADKPGDIAHFMRYITPDIGIVTAVRPVHLELFGSVSAVLAEKWKLAEGSKRALVNADDERLKKKITHFSGELETYGLQNGDNSIVASDFDRQTLQREARFSLSGDSFEVLVSVIATHSLYALVAAAAVAKSRGITLEKITEQIASWENPPGRMRVFSGVKNCTIIDDSYNASPSASERALETLYEMSGPHVAILGSMNELGDYAKAAHEQVGRACGNLSALITIGDLAEKHLRPAAIEAGLNESNIRSFNSPYSAGVFAKKHLPAGATVLVKGSQNGVFSEEATRQLLADSADASKLVRQNEKWQQIKKEQFKNTYITNHAV